MVEEARSTGNENSDDLSANVYDVQTGPPHEGDTGEGILINTSRGPIPGILHRGTQVGEGAILWASGARGGYTGPAYGIYADLAEEFTSQGITSLRLNYRQPGVLPESVLDVMCGVSVLKTIGCSRVTLVGHSFGGAVVIAAGGLSNQVAAVVSLSPQTAGAQGAGDISPRPLLIVHGLEDTRLPAYCATRIHQWAREPKELVLYPGTEHGLRECNDELRELLRRWIPEKLEGT